jgi:hypothetical protein
VTEQERHLIRISPELLEKLGEWSSPVEVRVERDGDEYTLTARTHQCKKETP